MLNLPARPRRLLVIAATIAVLLLGLPTVPSALAGFDSCRADPVIYLSDGSIMDISATINTSVSNVKTISYVLHVPRGVKLVAYAATPTIGFEGKELFAVIDDAKPGQYQSVTVVQTSVKQIGVTATSTWGIQSKSVQGYSGQQLKISFIQ